VLNRKNIDRPHHLYIKTRFETGYPYHQTGPTGKILTVHTTVLSEPDLNQVVNTTGRAQLEYDGPKLVVDDFNRNNLQKRIGGRRTAVRHYSLMLFYPSI